jgi:glycosyltransferase involved in cell wall biosynthesis
MFLITSMPVGGAETLLVNLVRRIDQTRFAPQICCLKERGPLGEEISSEFPVHSNFISHKLDVRVLRRLRKLLLEQSVDAVVTVGAGDKMFWGRLAARQAKVPVILSALHSTGWPDGIGKLNRILTGITDGFIAVAEAHRQFLIDEEKFPQSKVFVIPNGIDTNRFRFSAQARDHWRAKFQIPPTAPVCGIVAALRPEKNHLLFLRAAALVLKKLPDAFFMIVGDGPQRELLEKTVAETSLQKRVGFAGSCSDVPAVLSAMDLFSLTSHNEASPVSILEAMSCQRPVVATNVGSIGQSVVNGQTGYVVAAGDADSLSQRWTELLSNPNLRSEFGNRARDFVIQNGSLEVMVDGYENLIQNIFDTKQQRRSEWGVPISWESFPNAPNQQTTAE